MKTKNMKHVPIYKADVSTLEKIITTFKQIGERVKPRLVMPDDIGLGGMASLGWITNISREADMLYADISNIPAELARQIESGQCTFTPRIWQKMNINGQDYSDVLEKVNISGASIEAGTLEEFLANCYQSAPEKPMRVCADRIHREAREYANSQHVTYSQGVIEMCKRYGIRSIDDIR